jgi:hypothetical protein
MLLSRRRRPDATEGDHGRARAANAAPQAAGSAALRMSKPPNNFAAKLNGFPPSPQHQGSPSGDLGGAHRAAAGQRQDGEFPPPREPLTLR